MCWLGPGAEALSYDRTVGTFSKLSVAVGAIISTPPDSDWPKAGVAWQFLVVSAGEHGSDHSAKDANTRHWPLLLLQRWFVCAH